MSPTVHGMVLGADIIPTTDEIIPALGWFRPNHPIILAARQACQARVCSRLQPQPHCARGTVQNHPMDHPTCFSPLQIGSAHRQQRSLQGPHDWVALSAETRNIGTRHTLTNTTHAHENDTRSRQQTDAHEYNTHSRIQHTLATASRSSRVQKKLASASRSPRQQEHRSTEKATQTRGATPR